MGRLNNGKALIMYFKIYTVKNYGDNCLLVQLNRDQGRSYEMSALLFTDHLLFDSASKAVDEISIVCFNLTVLT